jgi:hypothetical protein
MLIQMRLQPINFYLCHCQPPDTFNLSISVSLNLFDSYSNPSSACCTATDNAFILFIDSLNS